MVHFMAASTLCGAAPDINAEIVGRVFARASGNGMYLGLLNLMSINTTDEERPGYLGLAGAIWGIGTVLGPILGGMLFRVRDLLGRTLLMAWNANTNPDRCSLRIRYFCAQQLAMGVLYKSLSRCLDYTSIYLLDSFSRSFYGRQQNTTPAPIRIRLVRSNS
jgi:MFS family permease